LRHYRLTESILSYEYNVADYGIPQFRSRVIIIGYRKGHKLPLMPSTHASPEGLFNSHLPYNTVKNVLRNMPNPGESSSLFNHVGREHSQRIIDRYRALQFGERDSSTRINKLHPNRPSYTIIVGSDKGGGKGHVHPYQPREVTPRESARIQTFPDWWEFYGNGRHVIRQVGNAVPPLFAAQLAFYIKKEIFSLPQKIKFEEIVNLLDLPFVHNDN
jgi:DNA (cytosine-5)-methyltransferase 1